MKLVLILNGREMRHDTTELLVACSVFRHIAVSDFLAILLDPQFLCHQPEQQIDVVPLPEQEEKLRFLKRSQDSLGEFFPLDRRDAVCGVSPPAPAKNGTSALPSFPVKAGEAPALTRKSNVAAIFETPVK